MKVSVVIMLLCIISFLSCKDKSVNASVTKIPRDTTITPQNAYTNLMLDSAEVEQFIKAEVSTDSVAQKIRNFYNARNFQYAWFYEEGLTPQAEAFWTLHNRYIDIGDSTIYNKQLHQQMKVFENAEAAKELSKKELSVIELRLTQHFFEYVQVAYKGKIDPEEMQWHIPRRKLEATDLLDSLVATKGELNNWQPLNPSFHTLNNALFKYYDVQKKGGWSEIEAPKKSLKVGDSSAVIAAVKKRLAIVDNYKADDTSAQYNMEFASVIKNVRNSFGLTESNTIDAALVKELNVPVEERIKQMMINLERMRWMPEAPPNYLLANIPEYRLHVYENGSEVMGMDIVVGKAANRTVIFSDILKYIVFSPYWNIPRSIVKNEIAPAMRKSSSYLDRKNMEVTGYREDGLPIVRQKPGGSNSLGRVKFIFPNQYSIYFHDTPAKSLFDRQNRAFSHGCIRLDKPFELAKYLLRNNDRWTDDKIYEAMHSGKEKWVNMDKDVPVFITYFTAWVNDDDGLVYFRDDIYGHDERMAEHLFKP